MRYRFYTLCVLAALAALTLSIHAAADILVVTDARHPVSNVPVGARQINLDDPARLQAQLNEGLPLEPQAASTIARQRLSVDLHQAMRTMLQGVVDAASLGVSKIPAVVIDRRYVVYGESDVTRAVSRINAYRSSEP